VIARTARRSPLDDSRFRAILLILAGIPITALYLWRTVVLPLAVGVLPGDFSENYMAAAAKIAAGRDPFDLCAIGAKSCAGGTPGGGFMPLPLAGAQYVTPLPVAWMLQPLLHVSPAVQLIVVLVLLHASLLLFLWAALRAIGCASWQMALFLVLVTISFEPVTANFDEGQVNLVLLGLSGVWLLGWVAGDRWWGGAALGLAVSVKLLQGPVGLLLIWGRRWRMLAAAAVAGLALWLLAVPQYLPEFVFKVAPVLSAGTGLFENHSPGGTVARLFDPDTFLGTSHNTNGAARVITILIALAVLAVTFWVLRRPSSDRSTRALEAAAIVAAGPLIASYSWGTHLVLLLLPMLVLLAWAIRRRDWLVVALVGAGWLLIGPAHNWFQTLLLSGYSNLLVLRLMAEFGVVGITAVWIASLIAVRRARSAHGLDAAREDGAEGEQHDRAREHDAVAQVG
jgi:Glycosyltransferase family 87